MQDTTRTPAGSVGSVRRAVATALGLALAVGLLSIRGHAQIQVPLPQILAEAEQAITAKRPGDAAPLLDLVLNRVAGGEALPGGLTLERVRLAAATVHFQSADYARAQAVAAELVASGGPSGVIGEGRMIQGLALALQEKFTEAVPVFGALEDSPSHRDRARLYRALAARQAGQTDVAIEAYERLLASAPRDAEWADSALVLVSLLLEKKSHEQAARGLALLQGQRELVDNVAGLNTLSLQLGDALLGDGDAEGAIAAYRQAVPRVELQRDQSARSARLAAQIERARAIARGPVAELDAYRRLVGRQERAQAALKEIDGLPGYDAALYLRLGRAFQERGGAWEAAIAFGEVLAAPGDAAERPAAHAGLVRAFADAGRWAKAGDALDRFAAEAPGDPLGAPALYGAAVAAQAQGAQSPLLALLARADSMAAGSDYREPLLVLHAQALLAAGRHEEARVRMEIYQKDYPRGRFEEEAIYLHAMAGLLLGRQQQAVKEIGVYLKKWPSGRFAADAGYRLAAAHYAMEDYPMAIRLCAAWLNEQETDHPQRGEVLALQGDAWAGEGQVEKAITSYQRALETPLPDELLGYVLDELTRHHQARREFAEAAAMWEAFARERPDHSFVINAAYWIGRIRVREGRPEEGIARVVEIATRYLSDPARDGVERLLLELAGMLARPAAPLARGSEAASPSTDSLASRIEALFPSVLSSPASSAAQARVVFLQAEVAALRNATEERSALMVRLAEEFPREALPPGILGRLGDHLLAAGRREEARACYDRIVAAYPRSIFADFGYAGLGEVALAGGRAEEALARFGDAIDRAGARFKLREATLGRARSLLVLDRLDAAQELFEQIAANREWRGEATAESVWSLGEILVRRGGPENLAQAQAHFQRVYLSYRKFTPWVARAYLRSAETFAELGRQPEAVATLREMLRDERLAMSVEAAAAHQRLAEWDTAATGGQGE
jgi:tetratricopeptide (TPR) repeat protein